MKGLLAFCFYILSSTGTSVAASENTVTSPRSGSITYSQDESGKTILIAIGQNEGSIRISYEMDGAGIEFLWDGNSTSMKTRTITAWKRTYVNNKKTTEVQCVWEPSLTGNNASHWQISYRYAYLEVTPTTTNHSSWMLSAKVEFNVIIDSHYYKTNESISLMHSPNPYV